jgi:hypothetical protein
MQTRSPTRRQAVATHERALRDHQQLVERLQRHPPTWARFGEALTVRGLILHAHGLRLHAWLQERGPRPPRARIAEDAIGE